MGYIKKVVDTGVEFAEKYEMPAYVSKARNSSKIIDVASEKIETFYCEKGSPLLQMVDDITAAKINIALDVANKKVVQAQKLKTVAENKVAEKKIEAIKMTSVAKQTGIEKYQAFKIEASKKVDETKTIMTSKIEYASAEAAKLEEKLKETASKNAYTNKVMTVVMTAKEQVMIYGDALVKKSLALPLTLQERMEKGLSLAKEQVQMGTMKFQEKKSEFMKLALIKYEKMTPENALYGVRTVFGEKAATKADYMFQEAKKANAKVSKKVGEKVKSAYAYSVFQVGEFAKIAEKMEAQYVGTTLVAKAKDRFTRK